MKKLLICLAATAAVCSAQAQSGDFTGFSAGGNLAMNAASFTQPYNGWSDFTFGMQSIGVGGFAGYGLSIGKNTVLTLGFDYSFSDIKAAELKASTTSASAKLQNAWSVSIAPGTMLTDKTLAYFKLGFENGKAVRSNTTEVSKNITGSSWGVGMKTLFDKNTFMQIEVKQVNYGAARYDGDTVDFTSRGTSGSVGVGFMF
jgi:opacity protein-like surface antigen